MNVLLASSYFLEEDPHEHAIMRPYPPLGLLYVSSYLRREGHDVRLFDGTFSTREAFSRVLARERPPLVGIYANILSVAAATAMIAEARRAGATVLLGGPDPSADPDTYLAAGADVVVRSEGEVTAAELVRRFEGTGGGARFRRELASVDGIAYVDEAGERRTTPARALIGDLDALPLPDRDGIDLEPYFEAWRRHHGLASLTFVTSRGCPFRCTWCSKAVFGDTLRKRSVASVLDEMRLLRDRYGVDQFWIADDVFSIDKRWAKTFCRAVIEADLVTPFECETRVDVVDEELLDLMARAGCRRIWYGTESGSDRVLREMKKGFDVEEIRAAVSMTRAAGISIGMFLMVGYPNEKRADVVASARLLEEMKPDEYGVSIAFPIKGTAFYEKVRDEIGGDLDWRRKNDPALRFRGRYPHRFYSLAVRYLHHGLAAARLRSAPLRLAPRRWVHAAKRSVAGLGMIALAAWSRLSRGRWRPPARTAAPAPSPGGPS